MIDMKNLPIARGFFSMNMQRLLDFELEASGSGVQDGKQSSR